MIGVQAAERSLMKHGQSSHAISQLIPKSKPAAKTRRNFDQMPSVWLFSSPIADVSQVSFILETTGKHSPSYS